MNNKKSNLWKYAMVLGFVFGFGIGIIGYHLVCPIKYTEISPRSGENVLDFYVTYLESHGYTVTSKNLSVNEFRQIQDFKELLWLLKYANFTECYVDYGYDKPVFIFEQSRFRVPKLWFQFDGVYWELRIIMGEEKP